MMSYTHTVRCFKSNECVMGRQASANTSEDVNVVFGPILPHWGSRYVEYGHRDFYILLASVFISRRFTNALVC
jgi:hypothetical protein